jgi:hypothetical protein
MDHICVSYSRTVSDTLKFIKISDTFVLFILFGSVLLSKPDSLTLQRCCLNSSNERSVLDFSPEFIFMDVVHILPDRMIIEKLEILGECLYSRKTLQLEESIKFTITLITHISFRRSQYTSSICCKLL